MPAPSNPALSSVSLYFCCPQGEVTENPARTNPQVTLMIPWLGKHDQRAIFPDGKIFDTPDQQEAYVREWAQKRTGFKSNFRVTFYPGRYAAEKGSILPVGDPTKYIADHEVRDHKCLRLQLGIGGVASRNGSLLQPQAQCQNVVVEGTLPCKAEA